VRAGIIEDFETIASLLRELKSRAEKGSDESLQMEQWRGLTAEHTTLIHSQPPFEGMTYTETDAISLSGTPFHTAGSTVPRRQKPNWNGALD
jgi:hypothetical protein